MLSFRSSWSPLSLRSLVTPSSSSGGCHDQLHTDYTNIMWAQSSGPGLMPTLCALCLLPWGLQGDAEGQTLWGPTWCPLIGNRVVEGNHCIWALENQCRQIHSPSSSLGGMLWEAVNFCRLSEEDPAHKMLCWVPRPCIVSPTFPSSLLLPGVPALSKAAAHASVTWGTQAKIMSFPFPPTP